MNVNKCKTLFNFDLSQQAFALLRQFKEKPSDIISAVNERLITDFKKVKLKLHLLPFKFFNIFITNNHQL